MTGELRTYVDVLQVEEVEDDAVAFPDDGRPQRPADAAGQHGAEANGDGGHSDPLLLRQAQLNHLCRRQKNRDNIKYHTGKLLLFSPL